MLDTIIGHINDALYSYILIILLVVGGLYFSLRTKFAQFRLFGEQIRAVTEKPKDGKGVSSFQALMVSTASRVGTGNIIGVSTAICLGGFGAIFWMWVIAIIGAASALIESTLAQIYKRRGNDDQCFGGPAYYIETALKNRPLAVIFSILLIVTYAVGFNMLASYNLQSTFAAYDFYNLPLSTIAQTVLPATWYASLASSEGFMNIAAVNMMPWIIGGILALLVGYCLFGGGKRILKITGVLVPVMGIVYILIALVIVAMNITSLPTVFARIFTDAFNFPAIFGGFGGSCVMFGIKRGLFSNEAGVGSAPNASASAQVSHPIKQGLVQVLSVFIDTILVCSATAFMCVCSGVEPTDTLSGAPFVQAALQASLGAFGPIFITAAMILFAFTTLLGNLYYVDQSFFFLFKREPSKLFMRCYYVVAAGVILLGAGLSAGLLWNIADVTMGLMTLINIPVIAYLSPQVMRALKDYETQRKAGKDPVFVAKNIELPSEVDYWQEEN